MKKAFRIIIFFAIGIGCIWWFIHKLTDQEIAQMLSSFASANYVFFFIAILINILSSLLRALRWQQLLKPIGLKAGLLPAFFSVMCGYLANLAVPRLGEVVRCGLVAKKEKIPFDKTIGTVIIERCVDMLLFLLILLFAMCLEFGYIKDYLYNNFSATVNFSDLKKLFFIVLIALAIIGFAIFLFRKQISKTKLYIKIHDFLFGILEGVRSVFRLKNPLPFIFHSLAIWFLWIAGTWVVFFCFPASENLSFKIAVIVTVLGAIGPMVTPGGIGLFPAIIAGTLFMYGVARPIGYAEGWLLWIVAQVGCIIIGLVGFMYFSWSKNKSQITKQ